MRIVLQRVKEARADVGGRAAGRNQRGGNPGALAHCH
jgi:D-Tyr-tRNAtyr deacylase